MKKSFEEEYGVKKGDRKMSEYKNKHLGIKKKKKKGGKK